MRLPLIVVFIFGAWSSAVAQDENQGFNRPLAAVNCYAITASANFGASKADFNKGASDWVHPFGYVISGGAGVSYMIKNNWGFEGQFAYELNSFLYRNTGVNLSLGYRAPYADLRIKKVFNPGAEDSFYAKLGAGYLFGGKGGLDKTESGYAYSINFISTSNLSAIVDFGYQKRTGPRNYMDFGVTYHYRFSEFLSTSMHLVDSSMQTNTDYASSVTKGSYIGITYKYYWLAKVWSKEGSLDRKYDSKF